MSTFGGDSWVPENLHRKRRVEELLADEIPEDEVRRLRNGQLACLVCPSWPVLGTMPMLHIHRKGAPHLASAEKHRKKKKQLHEEIQKRIALGSSAVPSTVCASISSAHCPGLKKSTAPLLAATNRIKTALLRGQDDSVVEVNESPGNTEKKFTPYVKKKEGLFFEHVPESIASSALSNVDIQVSPRSLQERSRKLELKSAKLTGSARPAIGWEQKHSDGSGVELAHEKVIKRLCMGKEKELRLREAGWRRDGVGGWFRDENVEFDSDEDDPVDDI